MAWRAFTIAGLLGLATSGLQAQTWQDVDVGLVSAAGSGSDASGIITVRGSGADVWDVGDEFHFRSVALSGDGEIVARVTAQGNTDPWAKAGIMMRNSLQANAPNAFIFVTPHGEIGLQDRYSTGNTTNFHSVTYAGAPIWLRLVRRSTFTTAYYSFDGTNWQGGLVVNPGLGNDILVGLAVTSHNDGAISTCTFDQIRVSASSTATPPAAPANLAVTNMSASSVSLQWTDNSTDETAFQLERGTDGQNFSVIAMLGENATSATDGSASPSTHYYYRVRAARGSTLSAASNVAEATTLSAGGDDMAWHDREIGAVTAAGGATESRLAVLSVSGSGDDVWGTADECHFRYKTVTGDCDIVTTVTAIDNTDPWAKAGVMMRASLEPGAPAAFLAFNPSFAATFQRRSVAGGTTTADVALWLWPGTSLRITRRGNVFAAYANGQLAGTAAIDMPATIPVGIAVTSHRDGTLCSATFQSHAVYLAQAPSPLPAPVSLSATAYTSTQVDLAWDYTGSETTYIEVHVSTDGVNFSSNYTTGGTRTTSGSYTPGWLYYFKLRARNGTAVSAFSNIVSVRLPGGSTLPAAPSNLAVTAVSSTSLRLDWRDNSADETSFRVFRARDGFTENWVSVDANQTTFTDTGLEPGTTYTYSVFATGNSGGASGAATGSGTTPPPAVPPPPLQSADIGGPMAAGQTNVSDDTVMVSGSGDDIWDTRDEFQSYARDFSGDGEILVRVDTLQNTAYWSKAGVMLRASSDPAAANIFLYVTPDFRLGVQIRGQDGGTTDLRATQQVAPPVWLRLKRTDSQVAAELSTDQVNWGYLDTYAVNLPTNARAGLAVTSHVDGSLCTARFTHFRIYGGVSTASAAPADSTATGWQRTPIGPQGVAGTSTDLSGGSVAISAAGTDIWDTSDGFVFYHRALHGDGSITARVQSLTNTHAWAKAGVMIRGTLTTDSPHVLAYVTPANGAGSHVRAATANVTTNTAGPWWVAAPYYLRLTRTTDTFATYGSEDGMTWSLISTQTVTMPVDVFIGLAVTSHDSSRLADVQFTNVTTSPP